MYYFLNWGRQLTPDELDMLNEDENLVSKKNDKGKTNEETSPQDTISEMVTFLCDIFLKATEYVDCCDFVL